VDKEYEEELNVLETGTALKLAPIRANISNAKAHLATIRTNTLGL